MDFYRICVAVIVVNVTTAAALGFLSESRTVELLVGEQAQLPCQVVDLTWEKVTWLKQPNTILYFGPVPDHRNSRMTLEADGDNHMLQINDLTLDDEGVYVCKISGFDETLEYQLIVNSPPSVVVEPDLKKVQLVLGESFEISCLAKGKPHPVVTWTRVDGESVFNGSASQEGEMYSIESADKIHTGEYNCLVSNGYGQDVTESIEIDVMYAPSVSIKAPLIYAGPGSEAYITCLFDANPMVNLMWQHNGTDINFQGRTNLKTYHDGGEYAIEIQNLQEADLGTYKCLGENDKGQAESEITISADPHHLKILSEPMGEYSDSYELEWQVESAPQLSGCALLVDQVNTTHEQLVVEEFIPVEQNAMTYSYQIKDLLVNSTYQVYLSCSNGFGTTRTEELQFHTAEEEKLAPPPETQMPDKEVEVETNGLPDGEVPDFTGDPNAASHLNRGLACLLMSLLLMLCTHL